MEPRAEFTLPSSPEDVRKINGCLKEMGDSLTRMQGERDQMKSVKDRLKEEFGMPPNLAQKLAQTMWKGSFEKEVDKADFFQQAYEKLAGKTR